MFCYPRHSSRHNPRRPGAFFRPDAMSSCLAVLLSRIFPTWHDGFNTPKKGGCHQKWGLPAAFLLVVLGKKKGCHQRNHTFMWPLFVRFLKEPKKNQPFAFYLDTYPTDLAYRSVGNDSVLGINRLTECKCTEENV